MQSPFFVSAYIKDTPVYAGNRYSGYGRGEYGAQRYGGDFYGNRGYSRPQEAAGAEDRGYSRSLYSSDEDFESRPASYSSPAKSFGGFGGFGGVGAKKPASGGKYTVGMKVRHAKFGNGTVVAVKNGGSVINVAFDGQGIKELSASLAPLTIIN